MDNLARRPVDMEHLDRYTGGDRALNEEILRLFDGQCEEMLAKLELVAQEADNPKAWHELTHTLKGAARGIGAFALADAVAEAEKSGLPDRLTAIEALQRIQQKSAPVHAFIEQFLGGAS